jgi:hypothetical protein
MPAWNLEGRKEGRTEVRGRGGYEVKLLFPQLKKSIKGICIRKDITKEEMAQVIQAQFKVKPLHPDYVEFAPRDCQEREEFTMQCVLRKSRTRRMVIHYLAWKCSCYSLRRRSAHYEQ